MTAAAASAAELDALLAAARAVVFDFDGVLVESVEIKSAAFLALFPERPDLHPAIRRHHLRHVGRSRFEKLRWIHEELLQAPLAEAELEALAGRFSALVFEATVACPLVPGAEEALAALERAGLPAFIVSGTPQEELRAIVERRGMRRRFAGVWGSPPGKRQLLWALLAERALLPEEVLFVGDGLTDLEAARDVGVGFVLRATQEQEELLRDLEVPRIADLTVLAERLAAAPAERLG